MVKSIFARIIKGSAEEALSVVTSLVLAFLMLILPYRAGAFDVSIDTKVTPQTQLVTLTLKNNTNRKVAIDAENNGYFEKKTDKGWAAFPAKEAPNGATSGWTWKTVSLRKTFQVRFSPATDFQKSMTPGTYRFVLRYWIDDNGWDLEDSWELSNTQTFAYEFQVVYS